MFTVYSTFSEGGGCTFRPLQSSSIATAMDSSFKVRPVQPALPRERATPVNMYPGGPI